MNKYCNICFSKNMYYIGTTYCFRGELPENSGRRRDLFKCNNCNSLNVFPVPNDIELMEYYSNYAKRIEGSAWNHREITQIIMKIIRSMGRGKILDIGCNKGDLLEILPSQFSKFGVEIAELAASEARKKCIEVSCFPWKLAHFDTKFDLIIALDFLEHVPDPEDAFKKMSDYLAPEGILIIETGNAESWPARILKEDWDYTAVYGHLQVLSPKALLAFADNYDIEVVSFLKSNHRQLVFSKALYQGLLAFGSRLIKVLSSIVPSALRQKTKIRVLAEHAPVGYLPYDHMIFIGKKRR